MGLRLRRRKSKNDAKRGSVTGGTNARLVWDTWRRILTSDELVELVLHPKDRDPAPLGLVADEMAILADYARTPIATDITIGMYRRGLVRNALAALYLVPLSRRLLYTSELDVSAVAADFVQSIGYRDDGPNLWRIAGGFVAHLAMLPTFASGLLQDVLALDAAAIALCQRLGKSWPAVWPGTASLNLSKARESDRYVASRAAVVVSTSFNVAPWLEDPLNFALDAELGRSTQHWLIYVPASEAAHTYAELSERAARAFTLLSAPKTAAELSPALDGLPIAEVLEVIDSLAEAGFVVCGEEA
ncbi:MAG TPA: hypothetical protein VK582_17095 [Pyrinomonadaceae bacterium]|nr:hypothetical protein [Pyrinomonadaceae bacterium]